MRLDPATVSDVNANEAEDGKPYWFQSIAAGMLDTNVIGA